MPVAQVAPPLTPETLWGAWTLAPSVLGPLLAITLVYARTVVHLWRRGGRGAGIGAGRVVAFAAAVLVLLVALASPLDALSEALFSAHMVQHLLLTLVAAPLLLVGRVDAGLVPAMPLRFRRRAARAVARLLRRTPAAAPVAAVTTYVLLLLVWHLPAIYDLSVENAVVHSVEHVSLLLGGLAFWAVMGAARGRPTGIAAVAAFVVSLISVLLAATMTSATDPWYASHLTTAPRWGLSPLRDQVLAAAIMWIPGGLVYFFAAAMSVVHWIHADEVRLAQRRDSHAGMARSGRSE